MTGTPQIPALNDPQLIDLVLLEFQQKLVDGLSWLNHAFGKAEQRKEITQNNRVIVSPSVYAGRIDYLKVFPDSHIGNFSFFDVDDNEKILHNGRRNISFQSEIGLIFWFDFRTVYPNDHIHKSTQNVKSEVVSLLKNMIVQNSKYKILRSYEKGENIYKGYTDREIDNQFLMRPYGGFRIDMEIKYEENLRCYANYEPPVSSGISAMIIGSTNQVA